MTAISFSEYAANQPAVKETADKVLLYLNLLCEALRDNYIKFSISQHQLKASKESDMKEYHENEILKLMNGNSRYSYEVQPGKKYYKINMCTHYDDGMTTCSAHAFVDKMTGEVYKAASWKSPSKGVRYNLMNESDREWLLENADWSGSYLYKS